MGFAWHHFCSVSRKQLEHRVLEFIQRICILTLSHKQPVDGERPCSTNAQTDERSAQSLVCFLRAAGGNVSRVPRLGEAGCPGFLRSSLALSSVFSAVRFLSHGHRRHTLPSDVLAFSLAYIQQVAELLMCCQSRFSGARIA